MYHCQRFLSLLSVVIHCLQKFTIGFKTSKVGKRHMVTKVKEVCLQKNDQYFPEAVLSECGERKLVHPLCQPHPIYLEHHTRDSHKKTLIYVFVNFEYKLCFLKTCEINFNIFKLSASTNTQPVLLSE